MAATRAGLAQSSVLTELFQDPSTGRIYDISTDVGYQMVRRGGLTRLGKFSVQGGRWPIGIDVAVCDGSGDLVVGTEWHMANNTASDSLNFNGAASVKLCELDTVLTKANAIPQSEVWNIKDVRCVLMDADGDGATYEPDPDFLVNLQKVSAKFILNEQTIRLGANAFNLLDRERVEKAMAAAGTTDVTKQWAAFSGEELGALAYSIQLSDADTFALDYRVQRIITNYANADVVAIRSDAIGTRYKFVGV